MIRAIRDYFNDDIGDILIDTDDIYEQAQQFMNHVMPESAARVKRYRDDAPLFSRFQIEHQIETAFTRTVQAAVAAARSSSTTPRRWCRSTSTRRAPHAAATSKKPPRAPTWKPPTRSRARCGCATWAA